MSLAEILGWLAVATLGANFLVCLSAILTRPIPDTHDSVHATLWRATWIAAAGFAIAAAIAWGVAS